MIKKFFFSMAFTASFVAYSSSFDEIETEAEAKKITYTISQGTKEEPTTIKKMLTRDGKDGKELNTFLNGERYEYNLCIKDKTIQKRPRFLGGLFAEQSSYGMTEIQSIFVESRYRRNENKKGGGLGTRLMEELETRAAKNGTHILHINVFDWQIREFLEKIGYILLGKVDDCPWQGRTRFFYAKHLPQAVSIGPSLSCATKAFSSRRVRRIPGAIKSAEGRLMPVPQALISSVQNLSSSYEEAVKSYESLSVGWKEEHFATNSQSLPSLQTSSQPVFSVEEGNANDEKAIFTGTLNSSNNALMCPFLCDEKLKDTYTFTARVNGKLVGGLTAEQNRWRIVEITSLFVRKGYRKHGIGSALVETLEKDAINNKANIVFLSVGKWQNPGFCTKMGYECFGTTKNLFPEKEIPSHVPEYFYFFKHLREPLTKEEVERLSEAARKVPQVPKKKRSSSFRVAPQAVSSEPAVNLPKPVSVSGRLAIRPSLRRPSLAKINQAPVLSPTEDQSPALRPTINKTNFSHLNAKRRSNPLPYNSILLMGLTDHKEEGLHLFNTFSEEKEVQADKVQEDSKFQEEVD